MRGVLTGPRGERSLAGATAAECAPLSDPFGAAGPWKGGKRRPPRRQEPGRAARPLGGVAARHGESAGARLTLALSLCRAAHATPCRAAHAACGEAVRPRATSGESAANLANRA